MRAELGIEKEGTRFREGQGRLRERTRSARPRGARLDRSDNERKRTPMTSTTFRPLNIVALSPRPEEETADRAPLHEAVGAIAPGIPPTPEHDLIFNGGKTIAALNFVNIYVAGDTAWNSNDRASIDSALAAAMSDPDLNNVIAQYFPGQTVSAVSAPSMNLSVPAPAVVSMGDVEAMVQTMYGQGSFAGFDLTTTVFNYLLPPGTVLNTDPGVTAGGLIGLELEALDIVNPALRLSDAASSLQGLGGYHGSVHIGGDTVYYAVGVYSQNLPDGTTNGIAVFDQPWKNVVATFYHELQEARTDPDVEDAIKAGNDPSATRFLGWMSNQGEEIGDFPVFEANPLSEVFQEVPLTDGSGTVPVQFMYSNAVHGPEGPAPQPE